MPGKAAYPMGRVSLPVTFSTEENFRTEYLSFKVNDFKSSYHAILGCPMLAMFMDIPHYTYLVLKIPAPHGVLTVYDDLLVSFKCDNEAPEIATMSACFGASAVMVAEAKKVAPTDLVIWNRSAPRPPWTLHHRRRRSTSALPTQPRRWSSVTILGRNRNSRSPISSGTILTYLHGPHQICQVFQGSWLSTPWM
jgi:hypothetical protein